MKLSDGKGMYLLVNPTGSKLWRWKYRVLGKEKVMSLGAYPDVSLAHARDALDKARKLLASGADPMAKRKADKVARLTAAENSFEAVARKWWVHWKPARTEQHAGQVMRRFEASVFPYIGARPVSEIDAQELVAMLKAIEARGVNDVAKRAHQNLKPSVPVRHRTRPSHPEPGDRHQAQRRAGVAPKAEFGPD